MNQKIERSWYMNPHEWAEFLNHFNRFSSFTYPGDKMKAELKDGLILVTLIFESDEELWKLFMESMTFLLTQEKFLKR